MDSNEGQEGEESNEIEVEDVEALSQLGEHCGIEFSYSLAIVGFVYLYLAGSILVSPELHFFYMVCFIGLDGFGFFFFFGLGWAGFS